MSVELRLIAVAFLLLTTSFSGCLNQDDSKPPPIIEDEGLPEGTFITNSTGMSIEGTPLEMEFYFSNVGEQGAEPSIGVTSSGCIFFIAFEKPMRSCDYGETWINTADVLE